jgi:hypothetical protein
MSGAQLRGRVVSAAEAALARQKYVAPLDVLTGIGWLTGNHLDMWRTGQAASIEAMISTRPDKVVAALRYFEEWAREKSLQPAETAYVAATRDRRDLRFTATGDTEAERTYRTHWTSPDLTPANREKLAAKQSKAPDLVVISPLKDWECASCGDDSGGFLFMENPGPVCLVCADLDHLVFLPSGDTALTRRARKASTLSAVVVRWSRSRKRYERQGILVEEPALEAAEAQCLADEDARARQRERGRERRAAEDVQFQAKLAAEIGRLFPGCPASRAAAIARHAGTRSSGRVGRTAAARAFDEHAITLAVVASVRHEDTDYDALLMSGVARDDARGRVHDAINHVLDRWRS